MTNKNLIERLRAKRRIHNMEGGSIIDVNVLINRDGVEAAALIEQQEAVILELESALTIVSMLSFRSNDDYYKIPVHALDRVESALHLAAKTQTEDK